MSSIIKVLDSLEDMVVEWYTDVGGKAYRHFIDRKNGVKIFYESDFVICVGDFVFSFCISKIRRTEFGMSHMSDKGIYFDVNFKTKDISNSPMYYGNTNAHTKLFDSFPPSESEYFQKSLVHYDVLKYDYEDIVKIHDVSSKVLQVYRNSNTDKFVRCVYLKFSHIDSKDMDVLVNVLTPEYKQYVYDNRQIIHFGNRL